MRGRGKISFNVLLNSVMEYDIICKLLFSDTLAHIRPVK